MKIPLYVFAAAALMSGSLIASAQSYQTAVSIPGITGATIYSGAPEGFDPISASASELEAYGYPPRPDPGDTKAYAHWVRIVSTTRVTPTLIATNRYHRPLQVIGKPAVSDNTTTLNSFNWSGYAITGSGSPPFWEVVGDWYVPNIGATTTTGYSSEWVGIDGDCSCNDLIQDGTEADYYGGSTHYDAWVEFIPEPEVQIGGFPIAPGDLISAITEKAVVGGKVTGKYFLTNFSTGKSVSVSLTIPPKTSFSGKSAEWIVERTEVNGSFMNPLPRYAYTYMDDAWAYNTSSSSAILYSHQPNENIRMYQGSTLLSNAYGQDSDSMWFHWDASF